MRTAPETVFSHRDLVGQNLFQNVYGLEEALLQYTGVPQRGSSKARKEAGRTGKKLRV
jgi:hypothetical protein